MNHTPMTVRGAEKLRQELDYLKSELRPQIIEAIADAREHGDLKENAEYHAAREQQGFCEGRIQEIEGTLSNAQIIDVTKIANNGRVIFSGRATRALCLLRPVVWWHHCVFAAPWHRRAGHPPFYQWRAASW